MIWLKWIGWGIAGVVGIYLSIVLLFALYFALAAYLPLLCRKICRLSRGSGPRSDPKAGN